MAFQVRGRKGQALYPGGTLRQCDGTQLLLTSDDVRFVPQRHWRSPQTGSIYPIETAFEIRLPEGTRHVRLTPLFDARELDGRAAGMPSYWEGLVSTPGGRGYLALTGYARSPVP